MKLKFLLALVTTLALVGCSKVTKENYDKVGAGMSYQEVTQILGEADVCEEKLAHQECTWGSEEKHIKVRFIADAAAIFNHKGLE